MGAGESAQAEYERRRGRDRERRRRSWKRSLLLVLLTPFAVYGLVRLVIWGINDWLVPDLLQGLADTTAGDEPAAPVAAEPTVDGVLANQLGLVFAAIATFRMAVSLWGPRRSTEAWAKGAAGERATGQALDSLPDTFTVLHDLKMPGSKANIDHVVIGPTGVFTVETKNYAKGMEIKRGKVRSGGRSMDKVVTQAAGQAAAMETVLGVPARAVVCVQGGPLTVSGWFQKPIVDGVRFTSGRKLARTLTKGDRVLSADQVTALASGRTSPKATRSR